MQLLREQRSRKCKKLLNLTVFLALLGSSSVKAAHKMLVKLTPRFNRPWLSVMCDAKSEDREIRTSNLHNENEWQAQVKEVSTINPFSLIVSVEFLSQNLI